MKTILYLLTLVFFILFSTFTEAAYISGQGYTSPFGLGSSNSYSGSYPFSYSAYRPTRTSVTDEFFSFPRGSGDFRYSTTRDSALESFSNTRNLDRTTNVNDRFVDNFFGAQARSDRFLTDNQDTASSQQSGANFDNGFATLSQGICSNGPSYERTLRGDFKGSRNDFTITESICGGQQLNLQRNFGNSNAYANQLSLNRRALQDSTAADAIARTSSVDRTTALKDSQQLRNSYSLQKSNFGQGYTLVFS